MRYMKIEHYVDRYTFDTKIEMANDEDLKEYEDNTREGYKKEYIGATDDPYSVKFTTEGRETLCEGVQSFHGNFEGLEGKLDHLCFYVVYFICMDIELEDIFIDDIMLEVNTKFGLIDLKSN